MRKEVRLTPDQERGSFRQLIAIDLVPDRVFVQTPGPRAGAALVPE